MKLHCTIFNNQSLIVVFIDTDAVFIYDLVPLLVV